MRRRAVVLGVILVAAAAAGYRYWAKGSQPADVEVAAARRRAITSSFSADGVVKGKAVDLAPRAAGRVAAILVAEGEAVRSGQILLRLEDREFRAGLREAEAAAHAAQAALDQAEAALVLTRGQSRAREAQARARLSAARAQLQQALAGPRPQEIAQAQQQVNLARANLTAAEQALRRARELHARGGIARAELDEAEARHEVAQAQYRAAVEALDLVRAGARPEEIALARAQVDAAAAEVEAAGSARDEVRLREADVAAARARLAQARAAVEGARSLLAGATLEAPFDGTIARLSVELGQVASPALPAVTLVDTRNLWISAEIAGEDAAKVRADQEVAVTVSAYPGRRLRGRIVDLAPQAELKPDITLRTRIVRARVQLLEGADLLRPGLEVDIEGESTVVGSALVVPSDALLFRENRNTVFVVEGGIARLREVRPGYSTYALTEILGGLGEGDLVVVAGKDGLADGRRVRIVRTVAF